MEGLSFYASQILDAARHIERNGATFYRAAADSMADVRVAAMMRKLAEMEDAHEQTFALMQQGLNAIESAPLSESAESALDFLRGMAEKYVFDPRRQPGELLQARADPVQVLEFAIEREKDSVIFYEGIRVMAPRALCGARLDEIVAQEMGHIMMLTQQTERMERRKEPQPE
jgi:rubrerythrin